MVEPTQVIISEFIMYKVLLEYKTDTIRWINYSWNSVRPILFDQEFISYYMYLDFNLVGYSSIDGAGDGGLNMKGIESNSNQGKIYYWSAMHTISWPPR